LKVRFFFIEQDDVGLQRALARTRLLKRRLREGDFGATMMAESAATATPAQQAKNFALQSYFIVSTLIGNDFNWLVVFYHKIFMNSFYHSFKIICWNMHQIDRIVLLP
jgi:hypothetical protein